MVEKCIKQYYGEIMSMMRSENKLHETSKQPYLYVLIDRKVFPASLPDCKEIFKTGDEKVINYINDTIDTKLEKKYNVTSNFVDRGHYDQWYTEIEWLNHWKYSEQTDN